MAKYIINPNRHFGGTVKISGSKNSALPCMAAALCTSDTVEIGNIPDLSDTRNMCGLLRSLGSDCRIENSLFKCTAPSVKSFEAPYEYVKKLRASFLLMAPLLARAGKVKIPIPGGCLIGTRPIDLHLKGFAALGAELAYSHGYVEAECKRLRGARIYLDFPSVGATENLMIAACLAEGTTNIENAAEEPEIFDLAGLLTKMGAKINTEKRGIITVEGVPALHGCKHTIIPDRIEAGTFITAAALCRTDMKVEHIIPEHLKALTAKLSEMNVPIDEGKDCITVKKHDYTENTSIKTQPYPGFPTDLQAPFSALMARSSGTGLIVETIFENRFRHIPELCRMGGKIRVEDRCAVITGVSEMSGANVCATDLRAGAALVIAALGAEGKSEIGNVEFIERGYEHFESKLTKLGADIRRVP